jgi:hypothetical protein
METEKPQSLTCPFCGCIIGDDDDDHIVFCQEEHEMRNDEPNDDPYGG